MNKKLKTKLIKIAKDRISNNDPSHDIYHALRVLLIAEKIATREKADRDIIIPSALFHDIVNYPKDNPKKTISPDESAALTKSILKNIADFPHDKIEKVSDAIKCCSFSKNITPAFLEAKILQGADGLEATGAISIMRIFSSAGSMKKQFYNPQDAFCRKRKPNDLKYALDLFFTRLLQIEKRLHTKTARKIVKKRISFLKNFLSELKMELRDMIQAKNE